MSEDAKGPIAWMAKNAVAANLCAAILLFGGVVAGSRIKQEVFPEFDLDLIEITVAYPGASPAEVEQGILLAVEEAVRGVDGVKRVESTATEGFGLTYIELELGAKPAKATADVESAIDRITSFPREAERPTITLLNNRQQVVSVILAGEQTPQALHDLAERARAILLEDPNITLVELSGVRPREISIEIPQASLRAHGLTLDGVAADLARSSIELPAGGIKTKEGEILLRTTERRELGTEFGDLTVVSSRQGARVRLADVAAIEDGYVDVDRAAYYDGKPAVALRVFRVGDQTPIAVSDAVKAKLPAIRAMLPPNAIAETWFDSSELYRDRLDLLMRNAQFGLILVMLVLGAFLEVRLAFWVTMGIPTSFLGALLFMPALGVSINMLSLFAFIVTLGMVVDDAIVIGENVHELRQRGVPPLEAAIRGAREVAVPVTFSILTTVAAFTPLLFVPGMMGKFFKVIPMIVIAVLIISLLEGLFVLPAHLAHSGERGDSWLIQKVHQGQARLARWLMTNLTRAYQPALRLSIRYHYVALAVGVGTLIAAIGFVAGGRINFTFMPRVDSDVITANVSLKPGVAAAETEVLRQRIAAALDQVVAESGGDAIKRGIYSELGGHLYRSDGGGFASGGSHLAAVQIYLVSSDKRPLTAGAMAAKWREKVGTLPGIENLTFDYTTGPTGGAAIDVALGHEDRATLEAAATELAAALGVYAGVSDINDGFELGKAQVDFRVKPAGRSLGLTAAEIGRQVRAAFFGAEVLRQQRGRDEVRVMVRLPDAERRSEADLHRLLIRVPGGGEVPLGEVAAIERGRAYTTVRRVDGRRVINVTADVDDKTTNAEKILADVRETILPGLVERYPGLVPVFEGHVKSRQESMAALQTGFLLALVVMFGMIAIPFKSYVQPFVVMSAIPFGFVGALAGHVIMGFDLSLMSMMGLVALSGVVVNDSIVLVDAANTFRAGGMSVREAVEAAGVRRLRPVLLTSFTTFFGLAPMIFETSVQARFLIPMALSLGFGVMFSTFVTLVLVPALFLIIEDVRELHARLVAQPEAEPNTTGEPQPS